MEPALGAPCWLGQGSLFPSQLCEHGAGRGNRLVSCSPVSSTLTDLDEEQAPNPFPPSSRLIELSRDKLPSLCPECRVGAGNTGTDPNPVPQLSDWRKRQHMAGPKE